MKRVFAKSVRDGILAVDPEIGTPKSRIPNQARATMLRNSIAEEEWCDERRAYVVKLTKIGRFIREILVELREAYATVDRMRDNVVAGAFGAPISTAAAAEPRPSAARYAGTAEPDSFRRFLDSLDAAGKNRWRDPHFMGEGPARERQHRAQEQCDGSS